MGRLSRAVALFHALLFSDRLHAVSVIDYSYFLSIHLRERYYRAAHSALLNQHGSRCHHNARGRAPDSGCAWVDTAQRLIAISERIHVILLGGGNLVDTLLFILGFWGHVYKLFSTSLRPAVLGHGLPTGHVHGLYFSIIKGN